MNYLQLQNSDNVVINLQHAVHISYTERIAAILNRLYKKYYIYRRYSYLSASTGSSPAALLAGIYPDAIPTIKHMVTPMMIHIHGIKN